MLEKQHTLKKEICVSGTGLHTGKYVNITFKPAHENHGIKFKRIDVENQPIIDVDVDNVVDTSRGTTIEQNGVRIYTTEHVLAAIIGFGIDNILIELDQLEIPIMDGSSKYFIEAFEKAGVVEQNAYREYIEITSDIEYINPGNKVKIFASPADDYKIIVDIDFETKVLNIQNAELNSINDFKDEISKCRTFVFLHELEFLLKNDLIKGGDLSNAIVFVNKIVTQEELDRLATLFKQPKIKVLKEGILNNLKLQYPNEPARHKLLDVVGDLALLGKPIKGKITAKRPGHASNVQFAKLIKQQYLKSKSKMKEIPKFDVHKKPIYDINQIKKILPHRPPFLFVDKIIELSDTRIVGLKNVTMNESFFVGHFPDEPIFPGVIQIEAMAQTGGVLVLNSVPDPENYLTFFMKIDKVKFRKPVVPGDTIVFVLELMSPIRRGLANMKGKAYVGGKVVMEAEMLAQISKVK
ncbi:MAG: bifunctional UDP-3-O-[3-hydroxymyristoyl] N-acetylglucosamine deacetylase/3-hydroxyacyl-ACP dehydratase [Bacteroidales bacterium]|nr:bifunctional UDP-3-O-[3-hydroxymyristoyl] N-acetylglucosamine deacetylase/3-hydroxyacyl-ACP dehydratase [Bacteroidales bacterium]